MSNIKTAQITTKQAVKLQKKYFVNVGLQVMRLNIWLKR